MIDIFTIKIILNKYLLNVEISSSMVYASHHRPAGTTTYIPV